MIEYLLILSLVILFFEFLIFFLFQWFKKDFQWLIDKNDINPKFNKVKFNNFIKNSYHNKLGWDRKPLTNGFEVSDKKTFFSISKKGFRGKSRYKKNLISVFGDSFAFCRYVNDNETWQYHLSQKYKSNVLNFGVGNYGIDQAFLKFLQHRKQIKKTKIIFCVVPETIARIFSFWKHFREFGNVFAIKPLVNLKKKKISIKNIPNLTTKSIGNNSLSFNDKFLKEVIKYDLYYEKKFKKKMFKFPYVLSFFKNFLVNINIFTFLFMYKILKQTNISFKMNFYNKAYSKIIKDNIEESHLMYENTFYKKKFIKLLGFIDKFFYNNRIDYSIVIVPQYYDIKNNKTYKNYVNFYKNLNNANIIDLTKDIVKLKNWHKYYFIDKYGGHLNKKGNTLLANLLYKKIKI